MCSPTAMRYSSLYRLSRCTAAAGWKDGDTLTRHSWSTTVIHNQTTSLGPKVDEVDRKVFELSANLEVKLQALSTLISASGNQGKAGALQRLQDTVRSAETVFSTTSSVVATDTSLHDLDYTNFSKNRVRREAAVITNSLRMPAYGSNARASQAADDIGDDRNSHLSPSLWEPDQHFRQWMATVVDFQDTAIVSPSAAVPVLALPPAEDPVTAVVSLSQYQPSDSSAQDRETLELVTTSPPEVTPTSVGLKSPTIFQHLRSKSAPSTPTAPPPATRRTRFWNKSRTRLQHTELNYGLKVHEPASNASFSTANVLFENCERFELEDLLSRAEGFMQLAKIPAPAIKNGSTCLKAVYVGDGACGKTCSLM
jgi:hypothetical protein